MVVAIVYAFFDIVILTLAIVYFIFFFLKKTAPYSKLIRIICLFSLVVIEAFKIPLDILTDNSYVDAIVMIIICILTALSTYFHSDCNS